MWGDEDVHGVVTGLRSARDREDLMAAAATYGLRDGHPEARIAMNVTGGRGAHRPVDLCIKR